MNRTARCIRMLMILKSRESVCTNELAELLETNPRNIREYKKELEEAGFNIETIRGAGGGYRLGSSALLPLPAFDEDAIDIFCMIRDSLMADPGLPYSRRGAELLDEIIASNPHTEVEQTVYFTPSRQRDFPKEGLEVLNEIRKAMQEGYQIEICYHSRASEEPITRTVDPYDVVCSDGSWYFVGFDHYRDEFRTFSISSNRLFLLRPLKTAFERDPKFRLRDYLGSQALIREDSEFYVVEVKKEDARFFEEVKWGSSFSRIGEQRKGWIAYSFFSDDSANVLRMIFRFGDTVHLISPKKRIDEYTRKLNDILKNYETPDDSY